MKSIVLVHLAVASFPAAAQTSFSVTAEKTTFEVSVDDGALSVSNSELKSYIQHGAHAIATYFGHFPMKHVYIRIRAVDGDRVRFGRSSPSNGGTVMLLIGREAKADALNSDWTLVHEMTHLAFPATKGDSHEWLGEGMATYVEPIARAQAGYLSEAEVWHQFVEYMPRGLPNGASGGLDQAQGFRRVYWGGALFCLIADIEIRKQTHNRKGLQDAFSAIMNDQGTMEWEWDINMVFEAGDRATGTKVLQTLYREWRDKPVEVDLEKLWKELGVERKRDSVEFNDRAPLAELRKGIVSASKN